jgi:molybdopterin-synthase adenylyltransferase
MMDSHLSLGKPSIDNQAKKEKQKPNGQVDQETINQHPVAIVGLSAVGSVLAEQLAKLGVARFVLVDPGMVRKSDLPGQGFHEDEMGMAKVFAVADRLQKIRGSISV